MKLINWWKKLQKTKITTVRGKKDTISFNAT
jgi:hypothetical protein